VDTQETTALNPKQPHFNGRVKMERSPGNLPGDLSISVLWEFRGSGINRSDQRRRNIQLEITRTKQPWYPER
jgi:hypothetical protein